MLYTGIVSLPDEIYRREQMIFKMSLRSPHLDEDTRRYGGRLAIVARAARNLIFDDQQDGI